MKTAQSSLNPSLTFKQNPTTTISKDRNSRFGQMEPTESDPKYCDRILWTKSWGPQGSPTGRYSQPLENEVYTDHLLSLRSLNWTTSKPAKSKLDHLSQAKDPKIQDLNFSDSRKLKSIQPQTVKNQSLYNHRVHIYKLSTRHFLNKHPLNGHIVKQKWGV